MSVSARFSGGSSLVLAVSWCAVSWPPGQLSPPRTRPSVTTADTVDQLARRLKETLRERPEEAIRVGETALQLLENAPDPVAEAGVRYDLGRDPGEV